MTSWTQDLRFAFRTLGRRPGFTLLVVLVLGLGLGSATALADLVNLTSWRPVPVPSSGELVKIFTASHLGFVTPYSRTSYADYGDYASRADSFTGLAALYEDRLRLDDGEATRSTFVHAVSGNAFDVLQLRPAAGRLLTTDDDVPGAPPVAVLSHRLWHKMGGEDVLGSTVRVERQLMTVVGILPQDFTSTSAGTIPDVFVPMASLPVLLGEETARRLFEDRGSLRFGLVGRLRPGLTRQAAQAELDVLARQLDSENPLDETRQITVTQASHTHPLDQQRMAEPLRLFGLAVALLLLITCANVAHLLLARSASRQREMAVRQSIGAGRGLLVRQVLTESLVLALGGAVCGVFLAGWARSLVATFVSSEFAAEMRFDGRVLGTSFLVCLAATVLFGLAPALATTRVDLVSSLKEGAAAGRRRFAAGQLLSTVQVALAVVLLTSGALLTLSLREQLQADRGFDDENLLVAATDLPANEYDRDAGVEFQQRFRDRVEALPEVESAGLVLIVPPTLFDVKIPLTLPETPDDEHDSRINFVDGDYFPTLGIELQQGRLFDGRESADDENAAVIVNRRLAKTLWPDENPLGRTIQLARVRPGDPGPNAVVVGVVGNVRQHRAARDDEPVLYFAASQRYRGNQRLVLRSSAEPAAVFAALRDILRDMDPGLALVSTTTGEENRRYALTFERLQTNAVGLFAVLGFGLAMLGIFGVLSYVVSSRVREIGIRQALGARRQDVLAHVVGLGARVALAGIALGLAGTFFASRLLESLVAGVDTGDARILASVVLAVLAATLGAAYLPARRAARLDPLQALRHE